MDPILGEIRIFAGTKPPANWHVCDGSTLSLNTYQALYSLLGTIYGGDGVTTFGIPDLRGRAVLNQGKSAAPANTTFAIAQKGGAEVVALTSENIPSHTHSLTTSSAAATVSSPANNFLAAPVDPTTANKAVDLYLPGSASNLTKVPVTASVITSSSGSGQAHENRQPFIVFNYIICLQGIYPTFPQ